MVAQSLLGVVAGVGDWVQTAVSIAAVLLGAFGVIERLWERREERRRKRLRVQKEAEALRGEGRAAKDEEGRPPPEKSQLPEALRRLWNDFRDLVDLGVSWVGLVCVLLLFAIGWLESLMLKMGFSEKTAVDAVHVDMALAALAVVWLLTGIRTPKRSIRTHLLETSVVALVCLGAFALVDATGSFVSGGICLLLGGIAFLKGFS